MQAKSVLAILFTATIASAFKCSKDDDKGGDNNLPKEVNLRAISTSNNGTTFSVRGIMFTGAGRPNPMVPLPAGLIVRLHPTLRSVIKLANSAALNLLMVISAE